MVIAVCGSCGMWELRGVGVVVWAGCDVGGLPSGRFLVEGVAVWEHCGVGLLQCGEVTLWGSCVCRGVFGVELCLAVVVWRCCAVGELWCRGVAV